MSMKLKVGLVGSSQLSFPGDKEGVFSSTSTRMSKMSLDWNFDLYVYPKQVVVADDAYEAVTALETEKVDFVLLQCTSFSAGFLAPVFARVKNARLGLWAIPEDYHWDSCRPLDFGCVPFNSLCSINMYSGIIGHYLNEFKVPIKWFFGDGEDPLFKERFRVTIFALRAIKYVCSSKVALIGGIAPGFDDLYDDERKLIRLFDGVRINRLHEYSELKSLAMKQDAKAVAAKVESLKKEANSINELAKDYLETNARFALAYDEFLTKFSYDAVAISCWPKFQEDFSYSICSVVGEINDKGVVAACEGDLTSAVSMLLLKYITDDITTLMDMSAMDRDDNTLLMWHCGPTSKRFCEKRGYSLSLNYSGMEHQAGETPVGTAVVRDMVFDPGRVTIARLAGEMDQMFLMDGAIIDHEKKSFLGSRGWLGELRLNREPISALDLLNTILVQRFQHHFPMVKGDYTREVSEAMAWLGLKPIQPVKYEDFMQNPSLW